MEETKTALRIVWARVGDKPSETTYDKTENRKQRRLGVTLIEEVPLEAVPEKWRNVLTANSN